MEISVAIPKFIQWLVIAKQYSPRTIEQYKHCLKHFEKFLQKNKALEASRLNLDLINDYRYLLSGKELSPDTQNYYLIVIRSFLKYLAKNDIKSLDPLKIDLAKKKTAKFLFSAQKKLKK